MTLLFSTAHTAVQSPKVVVVGGGLAGLTTAYRLQENGVDVELYEARNRIGGRIFSVQVGNTVGELGGQNITDGGEAKCMRELIKTFNLSLTEKELNLNTRYYDGESSTPIRTLVEAEKFDPVEIVKRLDELQDLSANMEEVLQKITAPGYPLYQALSTCLSAYEGATIDRLSPLYCNTLYHMLEGGLCAVHAEESISLTSIVGGNARLCESLATSLQNRLHLQHALVKVTKPKQGPYTLEFANGNSTHADILVLAIPSTVYSDIHFDSALLPQERQKTIAGISYGTNAKMLLPIEKSLDDFIPIFNDRAICFTDEITFAIYYTGDASRLTPDQLYESFAKEHVMIQSFFPKVSPPRLAEDQLFARYETPVTWSWPNDPYAKGSYSYIAEGQEELLTTFTNNGEETVLALFAPVDKHLYFAGEHTCTNNEIRGTMEAACESGEKAARMILRDVRSKNHTNDKQ